MAFAASEPLAELFWSRDHGLSLKRAESGLAEKKPLLLWNMGAGSKCLESKGRGDGKVDDEITLTMSEALVNVDDECGGKATFILSSRRSRSPQMNVHRQESNGKMEAEDGMTDAICKADNSKGGENENMCSSNDVQIADVAVKRKENSGQDSLGDASQGLTLNMEINRQFSSKLVGRTCCNDHSRIDLNACGSETMDLNDSVHSEPRATKFAEARVCSPPNLLSRMGPQDDVRSATGEVNKDKTREKKLEFSTENNSIHMTLKKAHSFGEMRLPQESSLPVESNSTSRMIRLYQEKGKMKALSDGDICGRSSNNEEDDSQESVESCNGARLFSKGTKRQSSDQELMIGSKKMKKQLRGSYGSKFVIRNHNSFRNWISNIATGRTDLNNEESPSLPVALRASKDIYGRYYPRSFTHKEVDDTAKINTGVQSLCQSYGRNTKTFNSGIEKEECSMEETKELKESEKTSAQNLPRSCDRKTDNSCKQIVVSNKEANLHISRDTVGGPSEPSISSAEFACISMQNGVFNMVAFNKEKGVVSPSDSLLKQVNNTGEDTNVGVPFVTSNMPEKCPSSSLWITRLCTRTKSENGKQIIQEAREFSKESPIDNVGSQVNDVLLIDQKSSKAMEVSAGDQVHSSEKEKSTVNAHVGPSVDFNSYLKPNFLAPSQKPQSSEAMASVFTKREGELKHTIPSELKISPTRILTCFFCGKKGHDLRDCTMVTETELEDLLVKISSFERVEESPNMCIRCFQLDHWAISCPLVSSNRHLLSEKDASFASHGDANSMQICAGNTKYSSYLGTEDDCELVAAGRSAGNVKQASSKTCLTSNEIQKRIAVKNLENDLRYGQNLANAPNKVAPTEMVHAIRKLCLSRTDILRWMKSDISLSRLDGFFLRLRLTKTEAGQGGTCYYVARISGDAREHIGCKSKKSILVDVGGIKSSVGSRYISNQDFQEDEIDAWLCRIVEAGGKTPSLDELNSRFKERQNLGF